jgi:hypothetical protein
MVTAPRLFKVAARDLDDATPPIMVVVAGVAGKRPMQQCGAHG